MNAPFLALVLAAGASAPPPAGVVIMGGERSYSALPQAEQSFAGRLRQTPDGFRLYVLDGLGRAANSVDLHAPGKAHLLAPFADQNLHLVGKVVPGTPARLWPGRIVRPGRDSPPSDGVIARAPLTLRPAKRAFATSSRVIRTPDDLAIDLALTGATAGENATKLIAFRMGRASIDFRTQMVVKIDGGLASWERQLKITRAAKEGGTLVIHYARVTRAGGSEGGLHNAGEMALVPRHDGPVEFRETGRPLPK